jgi:hypothetical protein
MMRSMLTISALAAALFLSACIEGKQGPAGPQGAAGPAGPAGPKGDKGDKGDPATVAVRLVQGSPTASCEANETMISAFCVGTATAYSLTTEANGAKCGDDPALKANVVCLKK